MGPYEEKARALFKEGYNCAQSVYCAFCDKTGLEIEQAARISSAFGGGMGRLREVCGGVSGMFMVLGTLYGYDDPKAFEEKKILYERVQDLAKEYEQINGSIICRELLGLTEKRSDPTPEKRTKDYYAIRPCEDKVGIAARILEEYIEEIEAAK